MGKWIRRLLYSVAILGGLLVAVASLGWWAVHTSWFLDLVRARVIAVAERATGGRVELGAFSYDPGSTTATAQNLVIHGTEPVGAPPLLRVQTVRVGLKILSLWRRDIELQSLVLERPQINLLVSSSGTNIPAPRQYADTRAPIQQLLDLKIGHTELHNGVLALNDRKFPLDLTADGFAVAADYNLANPAYDIRLSLPHTDLTLGRTHFSPISFQTTAQLFRTRLQFDTLKLSSGRSTLDASGKVETFDHPVADFSLDAALSIDDLARFGRLAELKSGTLRSRGNLHYDRAASKFAFAGRANARSVNYISPAFKLNDISAEADVLADNSGLQMRRAVGSARGARFTGEGSIKGYRDLQVHGEVSQVSLREVGAYLTTQTFPWSGVASGTAFASAQFQQADPNFIIGANVQIAPAADAIPLSGTLGITYFSRAGDVQFSRSQLFLPHSKISFDGSLTDDLNTDVDSSNISDLAPIVLLIQAPVRPGDIPMLNQNGHAAFKGHFHDLLGKPLIQGDVSLSNAVVQGQAVSQLLATNLSVASESLAVPSFQLRESGAAVSGSFSTSLTRWSIADNRPLHLNARFVDLNVAKTAALFSTAPLPVINGLASGSINLDGSLANPKGSAKLHITNLDAYGEQINQISFDTALADGTLKFSQGRVQAGSAVLNFGGDFHRAGNWSTGDLHLRADTNGFPVAGLSTVRKYAPDLTAQAEAHFDAAFRISSTVVTPLRADGTAFLRNVTINGRPYGEATFNAITRGPALSLTYSGKLLQTQWNGQAQARLIAGSPVHGDLHLGRLDFATLRTLAPALANLLPFAGFVQGGLEFDGSLERLPQMRANLTLDRLQISSSVHLAAAAGATSEVVLANRAPIMVEAANGVATFRSFEITGKDTSIDVTGDAPFVGNKSMNIKAVGKANLQMFSLFDPNVQSSGDSELAVNIAGPMAAPAITGALKIENGSFFLNDFPNGLSAVNGSVVFTRNRATIQKMTARSGGGDLSLNGFVSFGAGSPLVYHVEANAQNVRVRYANSISVTANSNLRLSGASASSILSGNLTVSRVVFTPNADVGNLLASIAVPGSSGADQGDFLAGLHFDVAIESAPNLLVSTNLSRDVEAEIQLRLRGTPDHPILLGGIAANQGDLRVFGTRYSLNRGEVNFVNTVRAEPVLDLDLETQTRGVTVDITISGTPSKLNFNYRSDPPLQPRDIIALLTVGRAPGLNSASNAQSGSDVSALKSGVNSVLGQAISPVSSRLSRLFGITNIRIDPFVQGITNTPQARLSVEQQISRDITITYVTNLSQTSEQIFRLEWALNRQFSIVALRDDNGEFGLDFQYKRRFK